MASSTPVESTSFQLSRTAGDVTMVSELVDCGKCPKMHGPYWYAYKEVGGRTIKVYVGRKYDEGKAAKRIREKLGMG